MTGTFVSIDGLTYTVNVGTANGTLILGEDPVHITWSKEDHIFVSLRSRECDIRVKSSVDLSSLYTDSPVGCPVTVYQGSSCIFYGFLTPQEWDAPFRGVYDEVELVAVDALSALKELKYTAVETNYPSLLTTQSIVNRACALIGLTGVPTMRSGAANIALINESAFLPRYQDVSEYDSKRVSWAEVLQAVATWEGYLFIQDSTDGYTLSAIDVITTVTNETPITVELRGDDSAATDVRISIEPAKSRVQVSYEDLEQMQIIPEIVEERMEDTELAEFSISDGTKKTATKYFVAKDWVAHDSRSGCGAVVNLSDSANDESDEHYCIVGPAVMTYPTINTQDVSMFAPSFCLNLSMWARNDLDTDSNGFQKLNIESEPSNFDPVLSLTFYDPVLNSSYTYTKTVPLNGSEGFKSVKILIYDWSVSATNFLGYFRLTIPDGCVVTGSSCSMSEVAYGMLDDKKIRLNKVENDGIIELKTAGWNDSVTIEARLRACYNGYAASDVVNQCVWNKFPFCETSQFEVPRKRFKATLQGIYCPMDLFSDTSLSTQKMIADGGDIDLKMNRTTLDMIETWVSVQ